jgi:hypothetical protein
MLKVEREVLGPCQEGGIWLTELVVRQGLIGEGLLNVLELISLSFNNIIVGFEVSSHGIDHFLD